MNSDTAISITELSKHFVDRVIIDKLNLGIKRGETLAIIGPNGSGKSTILRLLSGIIKPTKGSIQINGTVTSILDVGNGFHPDLTGRENCRMIAKLRGFSNEQIAEGIDHVNAFSELGDSFELPVKHYSNGMYLRLAFAIFERFHSDILLLDEVLAVGDASFRRKIAGVVRRLKEEGKTIVIVSHNMSDVFNFCDRAVYLSKKGAVISSDIRQVVKHYFDDQYSLDVPADEGLYTSQEEDISFAKNESIDHELFCLESIFIQSSSQNNYIQFDEGGKIELIFNLKKQLNKFQFYLKLYDNNEHCFMFLSPFIKKGNQLELPNHGQFMIQLDLPGYLLNTGRYSITLLATEGNELIGEWNEIAFFSVRKPSWMNDYYWSKFPSNILCNVQSTIVKK
jgi:ABC-type polysaccharide/polyol phosphate transport system ATPase subunit